MARDSGCGFGKPPDSLGLVVWGYFRVGGLGLRAQGFGLGVRGLGFRL
jgi:hypothetical protein